jgi:hypothetical protein
MGRLLIWLGGIFLAGGLLLIVANVVMHFMGLSASYNIGDPGQFEFVLISFWQIGIALVCLSALSILVGRRL